jgi:hypothetical protein
MSCKSLRKQPSFKASPFVAVRVIALLLASLWAIRAMAQTVTTLVPSSYVTTAGGDGGQPVATSIDLLDESGYNPVSGKYVPFLGIQYMAQRDQLGGWWLLLGVWIRRRSLRRHLWFHLERNQYRNGRSTLKVETDSREADGPPRIRLISKAIRNSGASRRASEGFYICAANS